MRGLDPRIHLETCALTTRWIAGSSPGNDEFGFEPAKAGIISDSSSRHTLLPEHDFS
jgi:hypothetical protein